MSEYFLLGDKKFVPEFTELRVVWDDENPDYDFKSRTQSEDLATPNPPAVYRYYKHPIEKEGDFRVNMETPYNWKDAIIALNGGGYVGQRRWEYLVGDNRATYNMTGWPKQAYLSMSSNILRGEEIGNWFFFQTLKQSDLPNVVGMTIQTHPHFVHRFTCVGWNNTTKTTKHIMSTGTQWGDVFFYLVTVEGFGFIPRRHVIEV